MDLGFKMNWSIIRVITGRRGVSSERRRSSCSSYHYYHRYHGICMCTIPLHIYLMYQKLQKIITFIYIVVAPRRGFISFQKDLWSILGLKTFITMSYEICCTTSYHAFLIVWIVRVGILSADVLGQQGGRVRTILGRLLGSNDSVSLLWIGGSFKKTITVPVMILLKMSNKQISKVSKFNSKYLSFSVWYIYRTYKVNHMFSYFTTETTYLS